MHKVIFSILCLSLIQTPAFASPGLEARVNELSNLVHQLSQTVAVQQEEIEALKEAQKISVSQPVTSSPGTRPTSASSGKWNPDIGVIADVLFQHDSPKSDEDGADRLSVRELELVMGSYIDPYSRMDVNIAFSDFEDVHIQEAYITRFGLPWDMTARIGRSKPKLGKALRAHRDTIATVDYPLVIRRYFGDDGLNKTGVDVTKPLDLPFDSAHEISLGITEGGNGEGGAIFGESRRRPTIYSHLKNFWDLSDVTYLEVGASHMIGSADDDSHLENNVLGLDATLIHLYGPNQRIKLQSEMFYLNQQESPDEDRFGTYGLLDVKFHRRWSAGLRFDYAELVNKPGISTGDTETGYSVFLTFFQTEFARWRLQYNHINSSFSKDDNEFFVQGIFAIGEHKHKLQ